MIDLQNVSTLLIRSEVPGKNNKQLSSIARDSPSVALWDSREIPALGNALGDGSALPALAPVGGSKSGFPEAPIAD
jgi:hypothetical protein